VAAPALKSREAMDKSFSGADRDSAPRGRSGTPASLEEEVRQMREEFATLHALILDREKKGRTLIEGYREVIADFADLFESLRNENIKRDESLRFFLNSIEGRLKTDIQNELSGGRNAGKNKRGWWPFRRSQ
jgi:sugar-specific transcriptional regulator TrmB